MTDQLPERYYHQNPEGEQAAVPEAVQFGNTETIDLNQKKGWSLRRKFGVTATAVVTAGALIGGGLAVANGGGDAEAKAPPVATAPANPTEQPTADTTEAAPTPSAVETAPTGELTPETFPLITPEGTFEGIEDFREAKQLLVKDYKNADDTTPDKKTINNLIHDFTEARNQWVNSGMDQAESGDFKNYSMKYVDPVIKTDQVATGPDAVRRTYDRAYGEALVKDADADSIHGGLAERIASVHNEVSRWRETEPSYAATITVSDADSSDPDFTQDRDGITFSNVITTYTDTLKNKNVDIETLRFTREFDTQGRLVWMITSFQTEPLKKASS